MVNIWKHGKYYLLSASVYPDKVEETIVHCRHHPLFGTMLYATNGEGSMPIEGVKNCVVGKEVEMYVWQDYNFPVGEMVRIRLGSGAEMLAKRDDGGVWRDDGGRAILGELVAWHRRL